MNYIKDNDMFTIVYVNKETIEIKQDYLYELEDKTTIDNQLKKEHLKKNLYKSLETLTTKQKRRVISYYFNNESIEEIALKEAEVKKAYEFPPMELLKKVWYK